MEGARPSQIDVEVVGANGSQESNPNGRSRAAELLAAQRKYKETQAQERANEEQAEQANQVKQEALDATKGDRESLLGQLREVHSQLTALRDQGIEERIAESERNEPYQDQMQETLARKEEQLTELQETIREVESGLAPDEEVAPEVAQELATMRSEVETVETSLSHLKQEIEKLAELIVSSEEIAHYTSLQEQTRDLEAAVRQHENDPDVLDSLQTEATATNELLTAEELGEKENELRTNLVEALMREKFGHQEAPSPEARQVMEQLAQTFLSEELTARGIHGDPTAKVQIEKTEELFASLLAGIKAKGQQELRSLAHYRGRDGLMGVGLRSLVDGDPNYTLRYLSGTTPGDPQASVAQGNYLLVENQVLSAHLGTFNTLRAYSHGLQSEAGKALMGSDRPGRHSTWEAFDNHLQQKEIQFEAVTNGPLVPKSADAMTRQAAQETFGLMIAESRQLDESLTHSDQAGLEQELAALEQESQELQAILGAHDQLAERRTAIPVTKQAREGIVADLRTFRDQLDRKQAEVGKQGLRGSLFGRKRLLQQEAEGLQRQISDYKESLKKHDEYLTETEALEQQGGGPLARADAERRFGQVQQRLQTARERLGAQTSV